MAFKQTNPANRSSLSSLNRCVEPGTRKGCPYISHGHMKLDGLVGADLSRTSRIHRLQHCHLEHICYTQCKLREGSIALGVEMLRFAQHDSAMTQHDSDVTHTDSITILRR